MKRKEKVSTYVFIYGHGAWLFLLLFFSRDNIYMFISDVVT